MSDITITGSGRLWCRTCGESAKPSVEGWGADLIVDWIQEHQCGEPTEEDLAASARDALMARQQRKILNEFLEAVEGVPVSFDPERDVTRERPESKPLPFRQVPLTDALGLYPEATGDSSPAVLTHAVEYEVSLFKLSDERHEPYAITVAYNDSGDGDRWFVSESGRYLDASGVWSYYSWEDPAAFIKAHAFPRETALRMARQQAAKVVFDGKTALEALKEKQ